MRSASSQTSNPRLEKIRGLAKGNSAYQKSPRDFRNSTWRFIDVTCRYLETPTHFLSGKAVIISNKKPYIKPKKRITGREARKLADSALRIQIAQRRYFLHTLGPKVGVSHTWIPFLAGPKNRNALRRQRSYTVVVWNPYERATISWGSNWPKVGIIYILQAQK